MNTAKLPAKIAIIGAGAANVSHSGELDAFAVQTLDHFRLAGIGTLFISPNSALEAGNPQRSDSTYLEPLQPAAIGRIFEQEKPDALFPAVGAMQGLYLLEDLVSGAKTGFITKKILSIDVNQIQVFTNPAVFSEFALRLGLSAPKREVISSENRLIKAADAIGLPFFVRFSKSEDGAGGMVIYNREELRIAAEQAFDKPPVQELIVEKSLAGWQEFDLLLLRDHKDNFSFLGAIEQLDPVGIHGLDSAWTHPAITLPQEQATSMEETARILCRKLEITGFAAIKFAFNSRSGRLMVLGLKPCFDSRAAFIERAHGLELGRAAARLALGEILGNTLIQPNRPAPTEFTAVRLPVWQLERFAPVRDHLAARSRSMGACFGLGEDFAMAMERALSCWQEYAGSTLQPDLPQSSGRILEMLAKGSTKRYQLLLAAMALETSPEKLAETTGIDIRFIAEMVKIPYRPKHHTPTVICRNQDHAEARCGSRILFIGPGPFRLGQGPAMETNLYQALETAAGLDYDPILLNNNPDGISTSSGTPATICWAPATKSCLKAMIIDQKPETVICHFGGPSALKAMQELGSPWSQSLEANFLACDRIALHRTLEKLGIPQPEAGLARNRRELEKLVAAIGFPLAFKGASALDQEQIELVADHTLMQSRIDALAARASSRGVVVESFLEYAIEVTADAISDGKHVLAPLIFEQVELAGVHSCDATLATPPYSIAQRHLETIKAYIETAAAKLGLIGPFNIRLAIYRDTVYLLELEPWASPTLAITSKLSSIDMAGLATRLFLGQSLAELDPPVQRPAFQAVRTPVFAFNVFSETDPLPGPQSRSTGEVLGIADDFGQAFFKSALAGRMPLPTKGGVLITVTDEDKASVLEPARLLQSMGFVVKATRGTCRFLNDHGITAQHVHKIGFGRPNLVDEIKNRQVQIIINTPSSSQSQLDDALIRKTAMAYRVVILTAPAAAIAAARAIAKAIKGPHRPKALQSYIESSTIQRISDSPSSRYE